MRIICHCGDDVEYNEGLHYGTSDTVFKLEKCPACEEQAQLELEQEYQNGIDNLCRDLRHSGLLSPEALSFIKDYETPRFLRGFETTPEERDRLNNLELTI